MKIFPEFKGIHADLQPYHDRWIKLAKEHKLSFKRKVSIGFKKIDDKSTIGRCWYLFNRREIEVDPRFWDYASEAGREALMYHELTHCFCGRDHDYGKKKSYPENSLESKVCTVESDHPGFFEDGCPLSMMHPRILDEMCYLSHYQHYIDEMFERCETW